MNILKESVPPNLLLINLKHKALKFLRSDSILSKRQKTFFSMASENCFFFNLQILCNSSFSTYRFCVIVLWTSVIMCIKQFKLTWKSTMSPNYLESISQELIDSEGDYITVKE